MKVVRINKIAACLRYWELFVQGFEHVNRFLKYDLPFETYRQMLFALVREPKAWVCVCFDATDVPCGFAIAHDCTPLFSEKKEYEVSVVYALDNNSEVFVSMQQTFEEYAKSQGVRWYFATTRRDSGSAIRCFQSPRFGFKRAYTVFKKEIK